MQAPNATESARRRDVAGLGAGIWSSSLGSGAQL
jgi:hypothetical protein